MRSRLIPAIKKPTTFYEHYPYFTIPTAFPKDEHFARARRTIAFANTTVLAPLEVIKTNEKLFIKLFGDVCEVMHTEHVSVWKSLSGTQFMLNEPYESLVSQNFDQELKAKGFIYITVPTNLSPYCGKWDDTPGALPRTKSYLICDKAHQVELNAIETALVVASKAAPAWNKV